MSNHVETVQMPEGTIVFDHSTCEIRAIWNNGYVETWSKRGYSYEAKLYSFYLMTEQWDKMANVRI